MRDDVKWLSYRERKLLGRALTPDEAREVTAMVRRIAAILLLESALDASYHAIAEESYPWSGEAHALVPAGEIVE